MRVLTVKTNAILAVLLDMMLLLNCRTTTSASPRMTVLFIIDGMACGTLERLHLPTLHHIRDNGVYFPDLNLPLPAHLTRNDSVESAHYYPWGCSLPNVMLQTGTLFIGAAGLNEAMIQHNFPIGSTVFVVNDGAYEELRYGYSFYVRHGRAEKDQYDYAGVIQKALQIITQHHPRFIRIHLQGTGSAGYHDLQAGRGLWSERSLYPREMVRADSALADFIAWLKEISMLDQTAFIVMGDHGQNDEGWHAPYVGQAHKQPVLFQGYGIKKGKVMTNASSLDIAPTVCHMNQVPLPAQNMGRALLEIFEGEPDTETGRSLVARLNETLLHHHHLLQEVPPAQRSLEFERANRNFLTIESIGSWHKHVATLEELVQHEERVLQELRSLIAR
jgi:hypothetical protein